MKLIILGNGYDIASNLPTKYGDFFYSRKEKLKNELKLINSFFIEKFPYENGELIGKYNKYKNVYSFGGSSHSDGEKYLVKINADLKDNAEAISHKLYSNIFSHDNNLNFWDLYFHFLELEYENNDFLEWNNIEYNLLYFFMNYKQYLSKLENYKSFDFKPYIQIDNLLKPIQIRKCTANNLNDFQKNLFYDFTIKDKEYFLLQNYFKFLNIKLSQDNIHWILLEELLKFEDNFRNYISQIMKKLSIRNSKEQTIYRDNLLSIIDSNKSGTYQILNFNYTSIAATRKSTDKINQLEITRGDKKYNIIENNVHGKYDQISIFGIDQTYIEATDPHYIFSKTYRKLSSQNKFEFVSLPEKSENFEIIFYGHSLSDADYSYFQSVFDYYDIYNTNVVLRFCYSVYEHSEKSFDQIRHEYFQSVTRLIKEYGNSMSNENHGNNLIHKLQLENRIFIKEIKLEKAIES